MAVEDHFSFDIPNEVAETLFTVGSLHSYIVSELRRLGRSDVDPAQIYSELRELICKQLGVKPEEVVPEAEFVKDLRAD